MNGFIEGEDRHQATLFPERLDDYIAEDSPVRIIDVFIDELDISSLGSKTVAGVTGRPGYHPATLLKLYILWLPQPHPVITPPGARSTVQRGVDVVDRLAGPGLQDHRRLSQGQWRSHPPGLPRVCDAVSQAGTVHRCLCRE